MIRSVFIISFCVLLHFGPLNAKYSADGCDWKWMSFKDHCYYFGVKSTKFSDAVLECENLNSSLASIWSSDERDFVIDKLWQPTVDRIEFGWMGLYGTPENIWKWTDNSKVALNISGMPQNKMTKCGAMRGKGSYAFLDCIVPVGAFVCKQPTPMLYVESNLVNYTYSTDDETQHKAELYERVWPPRMAGSPDPKFHMATIEVISETGCAYICSNLPGCRGFQLTCITSLKCEKYSCLLISGL